MLAAMRQESQALLRRVHSWKRTALGRLPAYTFSLRGRSCLLVTSGMGVRRAGQAAELLVNKYAPGLLISFGIAGAVGADLDIGDVILPNCCYAWDGSHLGECLPLSTWPEASVEVAGQALRLRGRRVLDGAAVTTGGSQLGQEQLGSIPHPVLEMETAGIARVARAHAIPLYSVRAISDGPRAPIPFDLGEVMDDNANMRVGKMLQAVLHKPGIILQSRRMMHNSDVAAENAAIALEAALSSPDFLR